jgi:hypothetical protein
MLVIDKIKVIQVIDRIRIDTSNTCNTSIRIVDKRCNTSNTSNRIEM